jgi:hypothetical protein
MVVLSRLVRLLRLLRDQVDSSLIIRLDANSLLIDEASVCPGVHVGEVHRVAREHNSASGSALHEVGILIACMEAISSAISSYKEYTHERSPR